LFFCCTWCQRLALLAEWKFHAWKSRVRSFFGFQCSSPAKFMDYVSRQKKHTFLIARRKNFHSTNIAKIFTLYVILHIKNRKGFCKSRYYDVYTKVSTCPVECGKFLLDFSFTRKVDVENARLKVLVCKISTLSCWLQNFSFKIRLRKLRL
jgi:hypothetical protein